MPRFGMETRSESLLDVDRLPTLVAALAVAVVKAQEDMDRVCLEILRSMAETPSGVNAGDRSLSMLELGFDPAFFQLTQVDIEARISISAVRTQGTQLKAEEGASKLLDGGRGLAAKPVDAGMAGRYSYPPEDASSVTARLAPVPPPPGLAKLISER